VAHQLVMPYRPEDQTTPANEAEIREQYTALIRKHHPPPDAIDASPPPPPPFESPSAPEPHFLPILKISDFQLHIHPLAFLFLCIFDLPVWRIVNSSTSIATHGLDSYYTDEQRIQRLLKPTVARCQPIHQLKSEKSMETNGSGGEYRDVPGDYYVKVHRWRLFPKEKIGLSLKRQLENQWDLANRKTTLISLARLLCFQIRLRDNICTTIRQMVERQIADELACVQRQRQREPPALSSDGLLSLVQCAELNKKDAETRETLRSPDSYPAFDIWWDTQQKGNLVNRYDPAILGLVLHWIDLVNHISLSPELRYVNNVPINDLWLQIFHRGAFPGGLESCNRAVREWTAGTVWFAPESAVSRAHRQHGLEHLHLVYYSQVLHWAKEIIEWRFRSEAQLMQTLYPSSKDERCDTHTSQQRRKRKEITLESSSSATPSPPSPRLLPSHLRPPYSSSGSCSFPSPPPSSESPPWFSPSPVSALPLSVKQEEEA
jgi:hypothetical protein